ncbi:LamG domain-containing protein [Planctomycetales bacterium ZRK34]|nr:LamG domain-containing protein [Planctomycetales bacterium ZRK34]
MTMTQYLKRQTLAAALLALTAAPAAQASLLWYSALDGDATAIVGSDPASTNGSPTATADRYGNAASAVLFDGDDSYIISPEVASLSAGTISLWVRSDSTVSGDIGPIGVGGSGSGEAEYFSIVRPSHNSGANTDEYRVDLDDGDNGIGRLDVYAHNVPHNNWHLLVATFTGAGTLELYLDGASVGTNSLAGGEATIDPTNDWVLGAERTSARYWTGAIDDAAIYDHVVTSEQVYNLYLGAATPTGLDAPTFSGIAKDSFQTTEDGDGGTYYDDGGNINVHATNPYVVSGTVGFSAAKPWGGSGTTNIQTDNDGPADGGLHHNLLSGELDGALQLKAKDPRDQHREIDAAIPVSDTYYMSVLLHANKIEETNVMSIGFNDGGNDRDEGFHVGFDGDQIAVFAGGSTFDLQQYELDTTYLVVLRMGVDASGNETLSAWVGADMDGLLGHRLNNVSLESFAGVADLGYLTTKIDGSLVETDDRLWWFDEVRLATSLTDLGVYEGAFAPTPAALPAGLALMSLIGLRRRR